MLKTFAAKNVKDVESRTIDAEQKWQNQSQFEIYNID